MENYFKNRSYLALYLNSMGLAFSSSLVLSFVGADLYIHGLPLYMIFLYFGLEFLFRGIFSPISGVLTSRYGFKKTVVVANILLAVYFLWLGLVNPNSLVGYLSFLMHALARGIYYPTKHYMQANFIENGTRGRYLTLEIVVTAIAATVAVSIATYSLAVWHTFLPAALLSCVFIGLASIAVIKLLPKLPAVKSAHYHDTLRVFRSKVFHTDRAAFMGFGLNMAFNNVVVALLVFFVTESLKLFGITMAAIFIAEMAVTLIYGRFIDKRRLASNKLASFLLAGSYGSFMLALSPLLVAIIKTFYDLVWNIYDSSFTARFHQKIKTRGLVYACAKEVTLSISCAAYCGVLALVALIAPHAATFGAALVIAATGILLAWRRFRD